MGKERADLGFTDPLDSFDPADWAPKPPRPARARPPKAEADKAAAVSGFRSREPKPAEPVAVPTGAGEGALPRRRRTGRNAQFNLKARPETIAAFVAIADGQGWGLGETLEKAVEALERDLARR